MAKANSKENPLAKALSKGSDATKKKAAKLPQGDNVADLQLLPLEISKIHPDPDQPRREWEQGELEELADSIEETGGCHTPIKVRPHPELLGDFMLVYGEGRWRSHGMKNIPIIQALIDMSGVEDENFAFRNFFVQASENITRNPMKKIDEARAYERLMNIHKPKKLNQTQLAKKIGKQKTYLSRVLKLLKAPESVQELSALNVTQNLNVLAYLAQASDLVTGAELEQLIDDVKAGDLGEKALQAHLSEIQNPSSAASAEEEFSNENNTNQMDIDDVAGLNDPLPGTEPDTSDDSNDDTEQDYGFYDYQNIYDKFIFDVLMKWDMAFDISPEQKDEMSEKLEIVTSEYEEEGHSLKDLLDLLKSKLTKEEVVKHLINVRHIRGIIRQALEEKAEMERKAEELKAGNIETLSLERSEVVGKEILLYIEGQSTPLYLTAENIKELKGAL